MLKDLERCEIGSNKLAHVRHPVEKKNEQVLVEESPKKNQDKNQ